VIIIVIEIVDVDADDLVLLEVVTDVEDFVEVWAQVVVDRFGLPHVLPYQVFFCFYIQHCEGVALAEVVQVN